jgi:hypothetical protein
MVAAAAATAAVVVSVASYLGIDFINVFHSGIVKPF